MHEFEPKKIFRDNLSRQKFSFWKLINENVRWKRLVWILKYFASFKSEAFDILGNTNTKPSLLKKNDDDFCCRICLNQTCKDLSVTKNYVKCPQVNIWTSSRKVPPKTCVFRVEDMQLNMSVTIWQRLWFSRNQFQNNPENGGPLQECSGQGVSLNN